MHTPISAAPTKRDEPTLRLSAWFYWPLVLIIAIAAQVIATFIVMTATHVAWSDAIAATTAWAAPLDEEFPAAGSLVATLLIALSVTTRLGRSYGLLDSDQRRAVMACAGAGTLVLVGLNVAEAALALRDMNNLGPAIVAFILSSATFMVVQLVFSAPSQVDRVRALAESLRSRIAEVEKWRLAGALTPSEQSAWRAEFAYWAPPILLAAFGSFVLLRPQDPAFATLEGTIVLVFVVALPTFIALFFARVTLPVSFASPFVTTTEIIVATMTLGPVVAFTATLGAEFTNPLLSITYATLMLVSVMPYVVPPIGRRTWPTRAFVRRDAIRGVERLTASLAKARKALESEATKPIV